MTRSYAAKRLLEHGPLTLREFREITGWTPKSAESALYQMVRQGVARRGSHAPKGSGYLYELAN